MAKKISEQTPDREPGSSIQPPSGKNTCCLFALIAFGILSLFLFGAVISGVILWKIYGPQFIEKLNTTVTSTVTKQITDGMMPSGTPLIRDISTRTPLQTVTAQPTIVELQTTGMDGEILTESNIRNVLRGDLVGLTPWELKVARNEIYARHGRPFVHRDLACYFEKTSWYQKDAGYTDSRLSALEQRNAVFILNYEKETGSPIWGVDTGCR